MLKIKDNVDPDSLGFKKTELVTRDEIIYSSHDLKIEKSTRTICIHTVYIETLDKLFDLIQAGLVEKVEG